MKNLNTYTIENSISLSNYMINEGILDWMKKAWNWLCNSVKKNTEKNNGKYLHSKRVLKEFDEGDFSKWKYKFCFVENFEKIANDSKQEFVENDGKFNNAYTYFINHKQSKIISVRAGNSNDDLLGFFFYSVKDANLIFEKLCLASNLKGENKNALVSNLTNAFTEFAKNSIENVKNVTTKK